MTNSERRTMIEDLLVRSKKTIDRARGVADEARWDGLEEDLFQIRMMLQTLLERSADNGGMRLTHEQRVRRADLPPAPGLSPRGRRYTEAPPSTHSSAHEG